MKYKITLGITLYTEQNTAVIFSGSPHFLANKQILRTPLISNPITNIEKISKQTIIF